MNNREKGVLSRWARNALMEDFDKFDFNAEIDSSLTYGENKRIIGEKIGQLSAKLSSDALNKISRSDLITLAHQEQEGNALNKHNEEIQSELSFLESLKQIKESNSSEDLKRYFYIPKQFCKMVAKGYSPGLILIGASGLGKTWNCIEALKEENADIVYRNGFTSNLELYHFLYENKDGKVIVIDDVNLFKDDSFPILKAALFSPTEKRVIRYNTTSSKLKYPSVAEFNSGVIILVNEIRSADREDLKAICDRVLFYELDFSYEDKLRILAEIVKVPFKDLLKSERQDVYDFIKQNTDKSTTNLNFRLIGKIYECYRFDRENWMHLALNIIRKDRKLMMIVDLCSRHSSIKEAIKQFSEETGLSRATFFRLKTKLR